MADLVGFSENFKPTSALISSDEEFPSNLFINVGSINNIGEVLFYKIILSIMLIIVIILVSM